MTIHDLTQAYRISDKILMLKNGKKVFAAGKPEEVLTPAKHTGRLWRFDNNPYAIKMHKNGLRMIDATLLLHVPLLYHFSNEFS